MHHLARHAVACFLTRGDLWLSWEQGTGLSENSTLLIADCLLGEASGRDVFDKLLIDADRPLFSCFRKSPK